MLRSAAHGISRDDPLLHILFRKSAGGRRESWDGEIISLLLLGMSALIKNLAKSGNYQPPEHPQVVKQDDGSFRLPRRRRTQQTALCFHHLGNGSKLESLCRRQRERTSKYNGCLCVGICEFLQYLFRYVYSKSSYLEQSMREREKLFMTLVLLGHNSSVVLWRKTSTK